MVVQPSQVPLSKLSSEVPVGGTYALSSAVNEDLSLPRKSSPTGIAYEVRWVDGGRERQKTFSVKRDAQRHAASVENAKESGAPTADLAGRSEKLEDVVCASVEASRPRLKPGTVSQYEHLYSTRVLPVFGKKRIAAISSQEV